MTANGPENATPESRQQQQRRFDWGRLREGFVLGALIGFTAEELGFNGMLHVVDVFVLYAVIGALVAQTRFRKGLWVLTASMLVVFSIIAYTPLVFTLMPALERRDTLRPAPAIVVLSASVLSDKSLTASAQSRVLHGYKLLEQGMAPELVLTNATVLYGTEVPAIRKQMQALHFHYPIEETGPVGDTHDEALEVARLARQHNWPFVILVTHPWHMRRAAAVFEKAGVHVLCSPCEDNEVDLKRMVNPTIRTRAFHYWLHETLGYYVYRFRGWI